jgi:hypothetical protein
MPLFDKVKAGAAQAVQKAQEAGKAGQAKLDEIQAKRHLDDLFRDLGAANYAEHAGRATSQTAADITRLYAEIEAHEAEHGQADTEPEAGAADGSGSPSSSSEPPAGDFKLD